MSGSVRALALAGIGVATLALVGLAAGALWLAGRAPSANVVEQTPQGAVTAITRTPTVAGAPAGRYADRNRPTDAHRIAHAPTDRNADARANPADTRTNAGGHPEPATAANPGALPPPTLAAAPQVIVHLVQPGNRPSSSVCAYGITVQELMSPPMACRRTAACRPARVIPRR
ncbi:MAG: hypothetical protein U0531_04665 [Dehalococcoidia bacterium]